ncbi:MAG: xylulokinase [Anaerolineaceae bacterium]|nr:xylulokinase [Anaerolineaceae bacterium]
MYLLGIDIGTSSVKTLIWDADTGQARASATQEYPVHQPRPGYAEQDPADWWNAVVHTMRAAIEKASVPVDKIGGIGLSGQMHGGVCINAAHQPVRPAIIWADTRSKPQVDDLLRRIDSADMAQHASGPPAAGFMAPTLMWLQQHEPEMLAQTEVFLLPKDYVRLKLTSEPGTDVSDAAATWLLDVRSGQWSGWLVEQCGLDTRYLPRVAQSADVVGTVTPQAAAELSIQAGIPVIAGCADQPAQALGYGLYRPGVALATIGTGGQMYLGMDQPQTDPHMRFYLYNHAMPNHWYAAASILAGGLALRWLRDTLGLKNRPDAYQHLSELAAQTPPGADGLVFLPHLAGERTPHMDPLASGLFLGLRLHHGAGHLARAVMEGVTFALHDCLRLVSAVQQPGQIIISGGAASSPVWQQIQADIYGQPVWLSRGENHACVGAALLAGVGCGIYPSMDEAAAQLPQPSEPIEPIRDNMAFYAQRESIYRGLYAKLKDDMHRLSAG